MGDMKTPDFDDLLAAFDIPDIDAKEAIQSRPEEDQHEVGIDASGRKSASPSCFPCSPASDSDRPAVSVIVKNAVSSESHEDEKAEEKSFGDETDSSPSRELTSPCQSNLSDLNSQLDPKPAAVESQISNGFEAAVPRNHTAWSPLRPTLNDNEGDGDKEPKSGSNQDEIGVVNSLKPLLFPQCVTSTGDISTTSPSPHSPSPIQKEEACLLPTSSSSPVPHNSSSVEESKHAVHSDDVDSEPDLGSPLVIHESPESPTPSPPKLKRQRGVSLENTTCDISHPPHLSSSVAPAKLKSLLESELRAAIPSPAAAPLPQSPKDHLPSVFTSSALAQEEKYPEHVIDERDSPESPPPNETGLVVPTRSSSPEHHEPVDQVENYTDFHHSPNREDDPGQIEKMSEKMAADEKTLPEEHIDSVSSEGLASASVAETESSLPHPLKVKIKMRTGSMARTVAGMAPVRNTRSSKPSPEPPKTKSKKAVSQQSQSPAASVLQDATEGAITAKQKSDVDSKTKESTCVTLTKSVGLPSVTSHRASSGGINLRSVGQKTMNSGAILSAATGSKPATIVNNTGALISKSQTSLVEAFNKILNNRNLLPSYKPDLSSPLPAEWGIPLPAQGYRCLECGDAFALEQSLARHYDRRSLRIEVTCNHCAKRLAFFNKCSLLLHAREHKERGLIMQCSHLVMKTVPVELMIGHLEPAAAALSSSSPATVTSNLTQQSHKRASNKKAEEVQHASNKCPECLAQFSSKDEVAEHFQEIKPSNQHTPCTECTPPMLLPNSCSAAAHQRIHQNCAPHVCPECGGTAKQPLFQTHLDKTCLHFSRRIGYRCSSCLVVFGGLNSVKAHIQQAHCDTFHKCPSCPMAFKSAPSIQEHISAQHPALTEGQAMLIYKCVMCDTVFTQRPLLHIHFETHLTNQKVQVFKCPECVKLFSQRNSLMEHLKTHKALAIEQELLSPPAASPNPHPCVKSESSTGDEWNSEGKEEKVKSRSTTKTPSGWKCAPCHARYTDREQYLTHMSEQHGKTLKKFPCNKCESSFTTTSSMRRHIRDKHKVISRGFRCQFCTDGKKAFSSRALLEKHVQLRHNDKDSENTDKTRGRRDDADSSSEQDSNLGGSWRRRRAVKTEQKEESTDEMTPVKKRRSSSFASSSLPDTGFRCAHCGFSTEDQTSFLEHISQHKRGGTEGGGSGGGLQCLQCGACFASTSSLSRHRFITHKVKDTSADNQSPNASPAAAQNHNDKHCVDSSRPLSPSCQPSTAHVKEEEDTLACKVCGKLFEKASDLNTHFRTHGMAFINARNAGKST